MRRPTITTQFHYRFERSIIILYDYDKKFTPFPHPIVTTWEREAILTSPYTGIKFNYDKKAVTNIIIKNIAEYSDAYIYLKPTLNREDNRNVMNSLRYRYDNAATIRERINEANLSL